MFALRWTILVLAILVFHDTCLKAQTTLTVVAATGQQSPGSLGSYSALGIPGLNNNGGIAFQSTLTGGSTGGAVFSGTTSSFSAVAVKGQTAPGAGTKTFSTFSDPTINAQGSVAFVAAFTSPQIGAGVFTDSGGSLQAAILSSQSATSGLGPATVTGFLVNETSPDLAFNSTGQVAVRSNVSAGSIVGRGIVLGKSGEAPVVAAMTGQAIPGNAGFTYGDYLFPVISEAGVVAFRSHSNENAFNMSINRYAAGNLSTLANTNQSALSGFNYRTMALPSINAAGHISYAADVIPIGTLGAIFRYTGGMPTPVAATGQALPGGHILQGISLGGLINGNGQIAFGATLAPTGSQQGIFRVTQGAFETIAVQGQAAPGAGGATYGSFGGSDNLALSLNNAGQVAFQAQMLGTGVTTANSQALFFGVPGNVQMVVRAGDIIDVDPGSGTNLKTVAVNGLDFASFSAGQDGRQMSLADDGTFIFRLTFTDGTTGIFTAIAPVPEPAFALTAAFGIYLGRRAICKRNRRISLAGGVRRRRISWRRFAASTRRCPG